MNNTINVQNVCKINFKYYVFIKHFNFTLSKISRIIIYNVPIISILHDYFTLKSKKILLKNNHKNY